MRQAAICNSVLFYLRPMIFVIWDFFLIMAKIVIIIFYE